MRPNKTGVKWRSGSVEERVKMNIYQRKYRAANLEKVRISARKNALKKYGVTLEKYQEMFQKQNGKCLICLREQIGELLSVDHSHISGKVRGLLCRQCNRTLGLFNDDPEMFSRASSYLRDSL